MSVDIKPYLQYLEKEKHTPKNEACEFITEAIKASLLYTSYPSAEKRG